jgi:hypothetical protein
MDMTALRVSALCIAFLRLNAATPAFEVASPKPAPPNARDGGCRFEPAGWIARQEQPGLKLESRKRSVKVFVTDRAEGPSEN